MHENGDKSICDASDLYADIIFCQDFDAQQNFTWFFG